MKTLCDKEIGSVKNGWHACNKPASKEYRITTLGMGSVYNLNYCLKHDVEKRVSCRYELRFLDAPAIMPFSGVL